MRAIAVLTTLMIVLGAEWATADAPDDERVQGTWVVSAGEKAGQDAPADHLKDMTVTFSGDDFTCKKDAHETKGKFVLRTGKSPREIVITMEDHKVTGIYKREQDTLMICLGTGDEPPAEFVTRKGTKTLLLTLKRKTP